MGFCGLMLPAALAFRKIRHSYFMQVKYQFPNLHVPEERYIVDLECDKIIDNRFLAKKWMKAHFIIGSPSQYQAQRARSRNLKLLTPKSYLQLYYLYVMIMIFISLVDVPTPIAIILIIVFFFFKPLLVITTNFTTSCSANQQPD